MGEVYLSIYSSIYIYKDRPLRSKDTTENLNFQAFLRLFFRLFPPILYSSSSSREERWMCILIYYIVVVVVQRRSLPQKRWVRYDL